MEYKQVQVQVQVQYSTVQVQTSTILHLRRFRDGGAAAGYLYGSDLDETDCSLTSQQVENNGYD